MADDKYCSLILTVDLTCEKCYSKIKKVISKHEERWNIKSVIWDEKNCKITLTGPFSPDELYKKLRKKASKIIKHHEIPDLSKREKEKPKSTPEKPAEPEKKDPPKPATPKPSSEKPADAKVDTSKLEPAKTAESKGSPKPEPTPEVSAQQPKTPELSPVSVPTIYPPVCPACSGVQLCHCGAVGGYPYPPWGGYVGSQMEYVGEEGSWCRIM